MEEKHGDAIESEFPATGPGLVVRSGEARQKLCLKGGSFEEGRDEKSVCYQKVPQPRKQTKRSKAKEARWGLGEGGLPWPVTTRVSPLSDNYMCEPHGCQSGSVLENRYSRGPEWDQHGMAEKRRKAL